jgi:sialate O-acetylesterase
LEQQSSIFKEPVKDMKYIQIPVFAIFLAIFWVNGNLYATVKLPQLLSNGMVLQRDHKALVWGWASPGEDIVVQFRGHRYNTVTDSNGNWSIQSNKGKAGGPFSMKIKGENEIVLNDVLVGDVWVCSGQSNMEFWMNRVKKEYASEIAASENPMIRQFKVESVYDFNAPEADVESKGWKSANPDNVLEYTAVGYFFAKELYEKYKVPIGLILSSKGGTPVESWMSENALSHFPKYLEEARKWANADKIRQTIEKDRERSESWYSRVNNEDEGLANEALPWYSDKIDFSDWDTMLVPGYWDKQRTEKVDGVVWCKKEFMLSEAYASKPGFLSLGAIADQNTAYLNGVKLGETSSRYFPSEYKIPENLLRTGRNVITVHVINQSNNGGFIKDKPYYLEVGGEKLSMEGSWKYKVGVSLPEYSRGTVIFYKPLGLYNGMIAPLTKYAIKGVIWYQGEANTSRASEYNALFSAMIKDWRGKWKQGNFPFLFVQLASYLPAVNDPGESTWAELREAQTKTLAVPNTGMAVTTDIGEWNDVHPKNKKDVGKRLALAARKVAYGENHFIYSGPVYRKMTVKHGKVELSFDHTGSGLVSKNGLPLKHFAIAGKDGRFIWANAEIRGNEVIVWNDKIKEPVAVRYAWADNPEGANLFNADGLPALPFRTDGESKK